MARTLALAGTAASLAVGGFHYAALWPSSRFFGTALIAGNDASEVALTFDDGPNPEYTAPLLDLLAHHQTRATFFLIARYVRQEPSWARAIVQAGHLVGSHTVTHPKLMYCSRLRIREEIMNAKAVLEDTLGLPVRYFRPPFGARRPEVFHVLRECEQIPVLWNVTGARLERRLRCQHRKADRERHRAKPAPWTRQQRPAA